MELLTQAPIQNKEQLAQWLQGLFPRYEVKTTMHGVVVGDGVATGVLIRDMGGGRAKLIWEFPNIAIKMLLTLSIVLTGILPGLIVFGLVWLTTKGNVERMTNEVAGALSGGAPGMAPGMGMGMAPGMMPARPTGSTKGFALTMGFLALCCFGYAGYAHSEYESVRSYSSSYGSYGSYGRYGRYGSYGGGYDSFYYMRRRRWEQRRTLGVAGGLMFGLIALVVGIAGRSKPNTVPMGGPMYPSQPGMPMQPGPYPSQPGFGPQPGMPQQGFASQQGFGGPPSQPGYPHQPSFPPQPGYPSQPGGFPQQGATGPTVAMEAFPPGAVPGPGAMPPGGQSGPGPQGWG
ncbi:MAG: hypothetical protein R3A52_32825 [Polyangiales bacterium]